MDIDDVAQVAARLEGVHEKPRGDRRGWYLDGRLVAREDEPGFLLVRCDLDRRERLLDAAPEVFSVTPRMQAHLKVLVDLDAASVEEVTEVLEAAAELQRAAS